MLLALDQSSTRTGVCKGRPEGPVSLYSFKLPACGEDYGLAARNYGVWLSKQLEGVEVIAYEKPCRPSGKLNLHTLRLIYGLCMKIEEVAFAHGIPCLEADNQKIKALLYGKGGKKPPTNVQVNCARRWGFDAGNSDEADAAGVFLLTCQHRFPKAFDSVWIRNRAGALV